MSQLTRWTPIQGAEGMQEVALGSSWDLLLNLLNTTPGALPSGANSAWVGGADNGFYFAFDDPGPSAIGLYVPPNAIVKVPNDKLLKSMYVLDGGAGRPISVQFFTGRAGSAR